MALANYNDLQASVAAWMNRTDLTATIPDFIAIAEARIQTDLRLRDGITTGTLTTVANVQSVALPTDWLEFESLTIDGEPLIYMPADRLKELADNGNLSSSAVTHYCIEGGLLLLSPTPASVQTIDIKYHARLPALSAASTNYVLTKFPNIYLYGSLVSGYQFTMNDQRANYWGDLYAQACAVAMDADRRSMVSGSPLTIRAR